eukprot:scaffold135_cov249-Pinguiococcus_pyrenoidosus.AAC.19
MGVELDGDDGRRQDPQCADVVFAVVALSLHGQLVQRLAVQLRTVQVDPKEALVISRARRRAQRTFRVVDGDSLKGELEQAVVDLAGTGVPGESRSHPEQPARAQSRRGGLPI